MQEDKKTASYENVSVKELEGSEVEIKGEIPVVVVESLRGKAVRRIQKDIELPGFRKGHVPEEMVIAHVGELEILKEIASEAVGIAYADIVEEKKLDVVGRPHISITKLAPQNPIGFTITSAVFPTVTLPEYKSLAEKTLEKQDDPEKETVSDEEVNKEVENIQTMMNRSVKEEAKEGEEVQEIVIDDAFAQKLGNFKTLAEFKENMKKHMLHEKKEKAYEKRRLAVVEAIIEKSTLTVPNLFIEGELDQIAASFNDRVARAGIKLEEYLSSINKTMDDLRKEWRGEAEKRAKLQIILNEIAKKEKIEPDQAKVDLEVKHTLDHYPEANKSSVEVFVRSQMTNEKVFEFLGAGRSHVHTETCDHGDK